MAGLIRGYERKRTLLQAKWTHEIFEAQPKLVELRGRRLAALGGSWRSLAACWATLGGARRCGRAWRVRLGLVGGPPRGGWGLQIDVDLSGSFYESDHGSDYLATDPDETGKRADTSMSLDPKRDRYLIILQNDAIPYVWGPTNLDVHWIKPGMERYTVGVGKPEYCSSAMEGVGLGAQRSV